MEPSTVALESVHILAYAYERNPSSQLQSSVQLRCACITTTQTNGSTQKSCVRHEFSWVSPHSVPFVEESDVSMTQGILTSGHSAAIPEIESTVLERNIADLITMHVSAVAANKHNACIIILGPPLPKIIGRFSYRCISRSTCIAFLSWPGTHIGSTSSHNTWHGPFPSFHEDVNVRRYQYTAEQDVPVNLDIFGQELGGSCSIRACAEEVTRRFERVHQIIEASPWKQRNHPSVKVPHDLGLLTMSLRWSDERFKSLLQTYSKNLTSRNDLQRIRKLKSAGIVGMRGFTATPIEQARIQPQFRGRLEESYAKEVLFANLESDVRLHGERDGFMRFIRGMSPI